MPMQYLGEARQTQSQAGPLASTVCFQFSFLESWQTRVQSGQPGRLHSHRVHFELCSTPALPCPSLSLIGYAVDAIDVQPGLETHRHSPDKPFVDPKTKGAERCPREPSHGGCDHVT